MNVISIVKMLTQPGNALQALTQILIIFRYANSEASTKNRFIQPVCNLFSASREAYYLKLIYQSMKICIFLISENEKVIMRRTVKEDLSQLIKRIVKEKKLKLRDVEYKSGGRIAQSYVSRLMTGNVRNLTVEKLIALARGLGIDPHVVFTAAHGHHPQSAIVADAIEEMGALEFANMMQRVAANADLIEMMREAVELEPEEFSSVLRYMAALNDKKR